MPKPKSLSLKHTSKLSKANLLLFALIFAAIGGYAIFRIFAAIPNPNLLGDINNDNIVNATDLTTLLANFNSAYPPADINNNGIVDIFDLATLITHYGQSYTGGGGGPTYYVSSTGSDSNNGTSQSTPWKTINKVNNTSLPADSQVLFAGGQTFSGLFSPGSSGTSGSPIVFSSYGSGNATISGGVYITSGKHDQTYDHLDFTVSGDTIFASQGNGSSGTSRITLQNSVIRDGQYAGVHNMDVDSGWVIKNNNFHNLGDSGLIITAPGTVIDGNTITNTGVNTALSYGKHSIYAKAADLVISNNDISNDTNGSLVSIRYQGAKVFGNKLHDNPFPLSFFPQDPSNAGTDYIYNNLIWNISDWVFYYAGTNDSGIDGNPDAVPTGMNVVFASNTIVTLSGSGVDAPLVNLSELTAAHVWTANNIFTGSSNIAYRGCSLCSEFNNDWFGSSTSIPSGTGDLHVNPNLSAAPALALPAGSSLVDKGTTNVPNLTYSLNPDGLPLHYKGSAPDMGAVELQ